MSHLRIPYLVDPLPHKCAVPILVPRFNLFFHSVVCVAFPVLAFAVYFS